MDLTIYSASWCRDCREAKRFLAKHNIAYKEIDIESVPGASEDVIANVGKRAIPQFVIDGKWVQPYRPGEGFLHDEMAELFGVAQ
jgi:glutaredoxin